MKEEQLLENMLKENSKLESDEELFLMNKISKETRIKNHEFNNKFHSNDEIKEILEKEIIKRPIGKNLEIFQPIYFDFARNIFIGDNVFINSLCTFQDQGGVYIGNNVKIGHMCSFATINHGTSKDKRETLLLKKIVIKDNAWLGDKVTVLGGVTIGENSIIGANSLVSKDIPDNVVAFGNPCKVYKSIKGE